MRAVFRADASSAIGSGHLSRCLTLAASLARRGVAVTFAMHDPPEAAAAWVAKGGHALVRLAAPLDAAELLGAAGEAELLVVDGYSFDAAFQEALRGPARRLVVVDDLAAGPVRADVVLNGNLFAKDLAYDVRPGTRLLVGPEYALVRDEIVAARATRLARPTASDPPSVLVTFGGADPTGETEPAVASLAGLDRCTIRVVVGPTNPRVDAIRAAASRSPHPVDVVVAPEDMGALMAAADVAVSAAGGTCLELACVGVASAILVVADNQRLVADAFERGRLAVRLRTAADSGSAVRALLEDSQGRRAMESAQRAVVDGAGKDRVAEALLEGLAK